MTNIHESWGNLEPAKAEKDNSENGLDEYIERIKKNEFKNIPREAFRWIYNLYYDKHISKCCSWINFKNIRFSIEEWTFEELMRINFIQDQEKNFQAYINEISTWTAEEIRTSNCGKHIEFWQKNGTWEIPPFILETITFPKDYLPVIDKKSPFLLIEGYSRFGLLKRFANSKNINLRDRHKLYIIK